MTMKNGSQVCRTNRDQTSVSVTRVAPKDRLRRQDKLRTDISLSKKLEGAWPAAREDPAHSRKAASG